MEALKEPRGFIKFIEVVSKLFWFFFSLYPQHNEVVGGYIGFTPSVRPVSGVRSVAPTILVGSISYYTSYQATSEGVSCVKFIAKFQNLYFWQFF